MKIYHFSTYGKETDDNMQHFFPTKKDAKRERKNTKRECSEIWEIKFEQLNKATLCRLLNRWGNALC